MKKAVILSTILTLTCILGTCFSLSGEKDQEMQFSLGGEDISARGAIGGLEDAGPVYEGDGEHGTRLAILAPQIQGAVPEYLPLYIQGLLNNNFKKYSGITIIERQNLDQILKEQDLGANGRFSETDFNKIGSITNAQYCLVGTIQKISGSRFSLSLSITDVTLGHQEAFTSKLGTLAQFEGNGILINQASAELLDQMGVRLTASGKQQLLVGSDVVVKSETGLAKGIVAQQSDATIAALFNFTQSIIFEPSHEEALSRLNDLSLAISGETTSQRILSDLQARDQWLTIFRDTARFYNDHPPFEITFDPNLIQEGETNFSTRTADLQMRVALDASMAAFDALNILLENLEKTGRRSPWGFNGWPLLDIEPKESGVVVFSGKKSFSYKMDVALYNEKKKPLGTSSITLNTSELNFSPAAKKIAPPSGDRGMVEFKNIKADDLTHTLTIVVVSVNGIPSKELNAKSYMKIAPGDLEGTVGSGKNMVQIRGGTFNMLNLFARPNSRYDSVTEQREVTISPFYIGTYEVSQSEYEQLMGNNPSRFKEDPDLPVEQVSWFDAVRYCNARSEHEGLEPAYTISGTTVTWKQQANGYRLPTNAEWEYAGRAGVTTAFSTGTSITTTQANYDGNRSGGEYRRKTTPVGNFTPNAWGLYDIHGNVAEWCWDWYGSYSNDAVLTNPQGPSSGSNRMVRGGSWDSYPDGVSFNADIYQSSTHPSNKDQRTGFRIARNASSN